MDPLMLLMSGLQIGGTGLNALSQYRAGLYAQQQANKNAGYAELAAKDAAERGGQQIASLNAKVGQLQGAQRVGYAASGVDVNSGTPADVIAGTEAVAEQDIATIRSNAAREAWGYKTGADNLRAQGRMAVQQGRQGAIGAVIGGLGQAAPSVYGAVKGLRIGSNAPPASSPDGMYGPYAGGYRTGTSDPSGVNLSGVGGGG